MKKLSERTVYEGQWLSVHELIYANKNGIQITWETVRRKASTVGVVIIARLMPSKRFILVKQFRPAAHGYVIGFPAGLAFDNPEHALVELKEETGYVGKIVEVSPILKTGSTITNDAGRMVFIEVDENDPANRNPRQELEPAEDIEVCLVKKEKAKDFLLQQQAEGVHISASLWYLFGLGAFFE